jgi:dihydrofolate reductase
MAKLIYGMNPSLDGYIAGPDGTFDWSDPDEELHRFHNERARGLDAHLLGRRLYETMLYWETVDERANEIERDFAEIWLNLPKLVFSTTLDTVEGSNTRLATGDLADEVARLKDSAQTIAVGGAGLAASLIELDLIDEYELFVNPVIAGGGTPFFPQHGRQLDLELAETRTFSSRVVYLRYVRI